MPAGLMPRRGERRQDQQRKRSTLVPGLFIYRSDRRPCPIRLLTQAQRQDSTGPLLTPGFQGTSIRSSQICTQYHTFIMHYNHIWKWDASDVLLSPWKPAHARLRVERKCVQERKRKKKSFGMQKYDMLIIYRCVEKTNFECISSVWLHANRTCNRSNRRAACCENVGILLSHVYFKKRSHAAYHMTLGISGDFFLKSAIRFRKIICSYKLHSWISEAGWSWIES